MIDEAFDALRHEYRRELLLALLEANPQNFTLQSPSIGKKSPADADQQFRTAMYHQHLPALEAYGFIRWDEDDHEIVKGPQFEDIRPFLDCIHDHLEHCRGPGQANSSPNIRGGRN